MPGPLDEIVRAEIRALDAYHVPHPENIRAKLDANESPFSLPPELAEELGRRLAGVDLNRYPRSDAGELREVVASDLGVAPEQLCFGNGSGELITMLLAAFAEPRAGQASAAVLYPTPSFSFYRIASLGAGVRPVEVPLDSVFHLDVPALDRAVAEERPNLAFFALPNNPTGTLWSSDVVLELARANPDLLVVADEAYADFGAGTLLGEAGALPNVVILRTVSKIGLAALRVGYLVAAPEIVSTVEKVRPPYNVGSLNQVTAAWLLAEHGDLLRARCAEVAAERDRLATELATLEGVEAFPSRANLILFRVPDASGVWQRLADRGVLVRNLDGGATAGCLRVTVGTREENDLFLEALAASLAPGQSQT